MNLNQYETILVIDALTSYHNQCLKAAWTEENEERKRDLIITANKAKELIGRLYEQ